MSSAEDTDSPDDSYSSEDEGKSSEYNGKNITIKWSNIDINVRSYKTSKNKSNQVRFNKKGDLNDLKLDDKKEYDTDLTWKEWLGLGSASGAITTTATSVAITTTTSVAITALEGLALLGGGAVLGAVGGAAYFGIDYAVTKYKNYKNGKIKLFNSTSRLYNTALENMNKIVEKLNELKRNLVEQEKKLNKYNFILEKYNENRKLIVMIGPTGYGKSLFCNRLAGNDEDIDDISKFNEFKVAKIGQKDSETKCLQRVTKKVDIIKGNTTKSYELSIVDTPGAFDSDGDDNHFINIMQAYFSGCAGINKFFIFFKFNAKMNDNYKKLLKSYEEFWGRNMWKYCCIIITFCDKDGKTRKKRVEKALPELKKGILKDLKHISKGVCKNVKIYDFGEENFMKNRQKILLSLINNNKKFKCNKLISPIDVTWNKIVSEIKKLQGYSLEIKRLKADLDKLKKEIGYKEFKKAQINAKKEN